MMCHDIGVILGDAMKAACAGHHGPQVYGIGGDSGGTLDNPVLLWHREIPGVDPGHSAAWTWDGEVLVFGWEPGGGVDARCQATSTDLERSLFFFDADGNELGRFVFTRFQGPTENCTLHNYNVVPLRAGRYVLVHGSYQSGTGVIDFTDPSNPTEIAWSDPPAAADGARVPGLLRRPRLRDRRGVVVVLVQRVHLRDEHHGGAEHLPVQRQGDLRGRCGSTT